MKVPTKKALHGTPNINPLIHLKKSEALTPKNHPQNSRNKNDKLFLSSNSKQLGGSKRYKEDFVLTELHKQRLDEASRRTKIEENFQRNLN